MGAAVWERQGWRRSRSRRRRSPLIVNKTVSAQLAQRPPLPLTLVDELDVLLVRGGEALLLLLLLVRRQGRRGVMVLLAVEAVENDLGRREAEKEKTGCHHQVFIFQHTGPLRVSALKLADS